ncbi:hypothetical protein [Scytonema sp. PCC 10023]|uniref:hypothetical protein n=1 Tax=Scytonema sp. PCC 10023 TaxID=1680591 RepID=UPI0039C5DA04
MATKLIASCCPKCHSERNASGAKNLSLCPTLLRDATLSFGTPNGEREATSCLHCAIGSIHHDNIHAPANYWTRKGNAIAQ